MKTIYAIGGGEIKNKETIELDAFLVDKAKEHAGSKRPYALFIPTASHDFMPYYNSFHKIYTGLFNVKTDVALTVYHDYGLEKIKNKFKKADIVYVGGGNTLFMIDSWKKTGILDLVTEAYNREVIICGLSAGAICWFEDIYTDSLDSENKKNVPYSMAKGLGWVKGVVSPHYDERAEDFDQIVLNNYDEAIGIENNSMIEIIDGKITQSFSSNNKNAYRIIKNNDILSKESIKPQIILSTSISVSNKNNENEVKNG